MQTHHRSALSSRRTPKRGLAVAVGVGITLALGACSGDNTSPAPYSTLLGFAKLGVPVVNGTITAKCGNGVVRTTVSNTLGKWAVNVPPSSLPCAIAVKGGTVHGEENTLVLYSVTEYSAPLIITNTTVLTNLALASAVKATTNQTLSEWFEGDDVVSTLEDLLANLPASESELRTTLEDAGHTWPAEFDPFTTAFTTKREDVHEQVLRVFHQAMYNSATTYSTLFDNFLSDGDVPPRPQAGVVHNGLAGPYTLKFTKDDDAEEGPFADGQQVLVLIQQDSSFLTIGWRTLTDPFVKDYGSGPKTSELTWFDEETNLTYTVTNNSSGTFTEIEVGDFSQPQGPYNKPKTLGKFRRP